MVEEEDKQSANTWPLVKFQFFVKIGDTEFIFQEVTGMSSETQVIEYRGGNSVAYSTVKMPGIKKYSNVTCKKGHFTGDKALWDKYNLIKMNTIKREVVVISLLDEENKPVLTWNLQNAFPVKMTVSDMKSDANEVAVDTIELAHEGLVLVS